MWPTTRWRAKYALSTADANIRHAPGLGMRIAEPGFTGQFRGIAAPVGLKSQGGSIDGISGATISSSGAVTAVNLAAEAYKALKPEILKTWGNK